LSQLKGCLAAGYPFVFGFSVYESFESSTVAKTGVPRRSVRAKTGKVPMPRSGETMLGGHAVAAACPA
jgi:C1A family cysteine protease